MKGSLIDPKTTISINNITKSIKDLDSILLARGYDNMSRSRLRKFNDLLSDLSDDVVEEGQKLVKGFIKKFRK